MSSRLKIFKKRRITAAGKNNVNAELLTRLERHRYQGVEGSREILAKSWKSSREEESSRFFFVKSKGILFERIFTREQIVRRI